MIKLIYYIFIIAALMGCQNSPPVEDNISKERYSLINQDSTDVNYPQIYKGKILVVSYIFTNCPDICPITTNNMRLVQQRIKQENIKNVQFAAISFDPDNDTPFRLRSYIKLRNFDTSNWTFYTGTKEVIKNLIKRVGVVAIPNDSTVTKDGKKMYFYVHTDRISLYDEDLNLRKKYIGSGVDIEEIVKDIKTLIK
ncbi:MAG: SCO family protein [bacterium]